MSTELTAVDLSWTAGSAPEAGHRCAAKTRYRQADEPCTLIEVSTRTVAVRFDRPQRAVTPGQSVVFYAGDECLGGGVIEARR